MLAAKGFGARAWRVSTGADGKACGLFKGNDSLLWPENDNS